jgi:CheY-like chemotaxis protein
MENLLRRLAGEGVSFEMDLAPNGLSVMADTGQMEQVLINLVTNARDAMPRGGRIVLRTGQVELGDEFRRAHGYGSPGAFALLSVSDTGTGMDERTVTSIFEPFFTTKEVGRGTGLGLSLVYGVVKQHNGYITVESEVGKGTEFSLYLPAASSQPDEYAAPSPAPGQAQATGTVLVAEDDAEVRTLARAILEQAGYTVIEAADGANAVDRFREQGSRIDLAILDVMMPVKNGREAYREIRDLRPGAQVLFISGYTTDVIRKWDLQGDAVHFLLKPFTATRLLGVVRALVEHGRTNFA